jgi:hypothetical protein
MECGVGERWLQAEVEAVTHDGQQPSDYAGMSNDQSGENPDRRKPTVSSARQVRGGLGGT